MRKFLPTSGRRARSWSPQRKRAGWLALWLQSLRRKRRAGAAEPTGLLADLVAFWEGDSELDLVQSILLPNDNLAQWDAGTTTDFGAGGGQPYFELPYYFTDGDLISADPIFEQSVDRMTFNLWINVFDEYTYGEWLTHSTDTWVQGGSNDWANYTQFTAEWDLRTQGWIGPDYSGPNYDIGDWAHDLQAYPGEDVYYPNGTWRMLTIVSSEDSWSGWMNGELTTSASKLGRAAAICPAFTGSKFRMKGQHPWGDGVQRGALFGVWHRDLSEAEIVELYNAGAGLTGAEMGL